MNKDNLCAKSIRKSLIQKSKWIQQLETTSSGSRGLPYLITVRIPGDGERIVDVVKCPNQIVWLL